MSDLTRYWVHDDSLFTEVELRPFPEGVGKVVYLADAVEARLAVARYDAIQDFIHGRDKLCFVCGAKEPCELKDDPSAPCTFEPTPMDLLRANQSLVKRLAEAERELMTRRAASGSELDCERLLGVPDYSLGNDAWKTLADLPVKFAQSQAENNRLTMENDLLKVRHRGAEAAVQFLTDKEAP